jgi:putative nucleotidyltransferase with HDIG domain
LKGVEQAAPHIHDVWTHTLEVIGKLEALLEALAPEYDPDKAANLMLGLAVLRLGRYRQQLTEHLTTMLTPDRSVRSLLFLAALYHDVGKPSTRKVDEKGRLRFLTHDEVGAAMASRRAKALHLSNAEAERLATIVRHHMRPLLLAQLDELLPTRRAIYRFFRDCGPAGVDICILSLADVLGMYGTTLPQELWAKHLDVVRVLLEAWWEKPAERVTGCAGERRT